MADEGFAGPWVNVSPPQNSEKDSLVDDKVQFEKELGQRPQLHGPKVEDCFAGWEKLGAALVSKYTCPGPDTSVETEDRTLPNGIKVRIYTPPGYVNGSKAVGLYIHGGGWAMW
jgi:versiconal hemiacetal acetate esterase